LRGRAALLVSAIVAATVGGLLVATGVVTARPVRPPAAAHEQRPTFQVLPGPGHTLTPSSAPEVTFPTTGSRTYQTVSGTGPVIGGPGQLMRFRIAVERDIVGLDLDAFARFVEQTYADPRGWTAGGRWRLQRVGP